MASDSGLFSFACDRGGTFTDVVCRAPSGALRVLKLLSEDPASYADAPTEGIRRLLEAETGVRVPRGAPVPTARIASIRMGTTVATNALLERRGARTALVVTRGFRDLLAIGTQARPRIFDLEIAMPPQLYGAVVEVDERLVLVQQGAEPLPQHASARVVVGTTGERIIVEREPDLAALRAPLAAARAAGATSCAVALMHSYAYGEHERAVGALASELGFEQVSLSHELMPAVKLVPRGHTACADAYLSPVLTKYVRSFAAGFEGGLGVLGASASATESVPAPASAPAAAPSATRLLFMQSDGGLADAATFSGHRAILSGPAGGCVGYAKTTLNALGAARPVCAFDMGGTSTDVSRFSGSFEHVFESTTAGVTINAPQLDINTVAAGGGSRLFFRAGLYVVGPESAGAHPGPLCYRKGGFLAVTDANVHLGRIVADVFPKIFGPREDEPLDESASSAAFEALAGEIAAHTGGARPSSDEVAAGFIAVANEAMCRPIRALTQMRGFDLTTHVLACFGGAGPQHACAMARALGVSTIFISRFAGVLSAYGLLLADVVAEARAPCAESLAAAPAGSEDPGLCDAAVAAALAARLLALARDAGAQLAAQGAAAADVHLDLFVHARFLGTDSGLMVSVGTFAHAALLGRAAADAERDVAAALSQTPRDFAAAYRREFGFVLRGRQMLAEDLRVRATARGSAGATFSVAAAPSAEPPRAARTRRVFFDGGRVETPVFSLDDLLAGHVVRGPALVLHTTTTIVVEPGFEAVVLPTGDVRIDALSAGGSRAAATGQVEASLAAAGPAEAPPSAAAPAIPECDPIRLSVFAHRFMGIAEQMGRTLQRTAVSVNMRERLDYSCALFGLDGGLVANAPHIPVHLGAMQDAVRFQLAHWGAENLRDGDVLVSNHPQLAGGSHLPDITVITPVFSDGSIVFFVASRGHHADIGGIAPGAQLARARMLAQPRLPNPPPSLLTRRSPPLPPPLSVQRRLNAAALALAVRGGRRDRGAQARERGRGLRRGGHHVDPRGRRLAQPARLPQRPARAGGRQHARHRACARAHC